MRGKAISRTALLSAACALVLATPGWAQYREYYIRGRVLDTQKQPLAGVAIRLLDPATSRTYDMKTGKDGVFKFAGLPHGVYAVTFRALGFAPKDDEWKFETPQETMQRVELPDVVLVSQAQVQKQQQLKEAESGVKQAAERIRAGDFDGVITLAKGILEKHPEDANALFFLGLAYSRKKMCAEAVPSFTRVTELTPAFVPAHLELGVCHRQLGHTEEALASYRKALALDPANADASYNAGLILFETNRIEEALADFQAGLTGKPSDPDLLEMAGRCYIHQAKFAEAVAHFEKARAATTDPAKAAFLDEMIRKLKAQIQ